MQENVDTIVKGWYVVTMNATRDIIRNGAVAIRGRDIVAVGKASDIEARYIAKETVPAVGGGAPTEMTLSVPDLQLGPGDFVQVVFYQNCGGPLDVTVSTFSPVATWKFWRAG